MNGRDALLGNVTRYPIVFERGEGAWLYDRDGRRYLDLLAGIATTSLGHAHPDVVEVLSRTAGRLWHVSNLFYTAEAIAAAERIAGLLGAGRVYLCNSGTEANEAAIKLARKLHWRRGARARTEIVSLEGGFHGRTLGSLAATIQPAKWTGFGPLPGSFRSVPPNDAEALALVVGERTAAILLETVQGEGGVRPLEDGFVRAACERAADAGALVIIDEIQTGVARTGRWWGFEHHGIRPDVVTVGKALGNGFPVAAMWASEDVAEGLGPGDHSTTIGGGPLASAVAVAVLDTIERDGLVERAARLGTLLAAELGSHVTEVRGRGALLALELGAPRANAVVREALDRGLIVNDVTPSAVRIAPPLILSDGEALEGARLLRESIEAAGGPWPSETEEA